LTVVLQHHLTRAGSSLSAQAHAFGSTFWWVVVVIAVALIPTVTLMLLERPRSSWAVLRRLATVFENHQGVGEHDGGTEPLAGSSVLTSGATARPANIASSS
jgi:hypothetical protein